MKIDRSLATASGESAPPRRTPPTLRLVPETLESVLTRLIAQQRADLAGQADFADTCRRDAIAAIMIGRATGLLTSAKPELAACH